MREFVNNLQYYIERITLKLSCLFYCEYSISHIQVDSFGKEFPLKEPLVKGLFAIKQAIKKDIRYTPVMKLNKNNIFSVKSVYNIRFNGDYIHISRMADDKTLSISMVYSLDRFFKKEFYVTAYCYNSNGRMKLTAKIFYDAVQELIQLTNADVKESRKLNITNA